MLISQAEKSLNGALSVTLLTISTLTIMVGAVIAPALAPISKQLGMSEYSSLLITMPSLGVVLFAPFAGRLISRLGGKIAVFWGLIAYGALGLIGSVIPNIYLMLLSRFALGCVTAVVMAGGTSLIAELYSGDARLKMIAKQGMAIELGGVVFLSIGGILAGVHWQLPFGLYAIGWVFAVMVGVFVPSSGAIQNNEANPDTSGLKKVLDLYVVSIASMIVFFAAFITLPHALAAYGYTETHIGFYLAFTSLMAVVAAGFMPKLRKDNYASKIFMFAFACYALAYLILGLTLVLPGIILAAMFMGTGFGLTIPLTNYEMIERSSETDRNRNLAYLSSAIFLGQFLSTFLELSSSSYVLTFIMASIFSTIIIAAIFMGSKNGKSGLSA